MREASSKARNYWMFERAIADGILDKPNTWFQVRTTDFEDTGKSVNLTNNFWVGGLHSFEAHGQYFIRITGENAGTYSVEVKQEVIHWVGTDRADTRSVAEKNTNTVLYAAETLGGWFGDGLLGADLRFAIHDQQDDFETRRFFVFKSEMCKSTPFGDN